MMAVTKKVCTEVGIDSDNILLGTDIEKMDDENRIIKFSK